MKRRAFVAGLPAGLAVGTMAAAPATAQAAAVGFGYANVKDFGAVGDGVADDRAAIQAAINSCPSTGGGVFFPPGTYAISSALKLKANVTVCGSGVGSKLVPRVAGINIIEFIASSMQAANVEISSLEIDSRGTASTNGIVMRLVQYVRISQVTFTGCSFSISLDRCRTVAISDSLSRGHPAIKGGTLRIYSSTATDYCFDVTVTNYTTFNIGNGTANGHGIIVNRGVAVTISGYILNDGNHGGGVRGIGFYGDCQGCRVSDSLMAAVTGGIVFAKDIYNTSNLIVPSFCTITSVDVDQPQTAGMWINAGNWITFNGGSYTASGVNTGASGVLAQGGSRLTFNALTIHGFSNGHGVLVGSGVSNVTLSASQIESCGTGIGVVAGSSQYVSITGNRLISNPLPINFGGSASNNIVRMNIGAADLY